VIGAARPCISIAAFRHRMERIGMNAGSASERSRTESARARGTTVTLCPVRACTRASCAAGPCRAPMDAASAHGTAPTPRAAPAGRLRPSARRRLSSPAASSSAS
jgi:hypothetical protein